MFSEPPNLSTRDRDRLDELAKSLACAWDEARQIGSTVVLAEFFPSAGDALRTAALPALVGVDLRQRWKRGESVYVEDYLKQFPELGTADTVAPQLIADEYLARQQFGDQVPLRRYADRFPRQYEAVRGLLPDAAGSASPLGTLVPSRPTADSSAARSSGAGDSSASKTLPVGATPSGSAVARTPSVVTGAQVVLPFGDGYKLIDRIDKGKEGQFGDVWLAEAPGGIEVAVKVIRFPLGHKMSQIELRALELMKRIKHTFLLQIQAYWATEDQLLIVMELADGTLNDRAKECQRLYKSGIPVDELLGYFRESAEALDYLHSKEVLHRDIKPANILLVEGHAKVGDFGLARVLQRKELSVTATSMGTPLYMAPEVWGGKAGPRSDQYSLALAYVELRLGRPAYPSDSFAEVMRDHLERSPQLDPIPLDEQRVILKALSKDLQNRYESCSDFAQALIDAVHRQPPPPPPPPPWRWMLALAGVLLAIVAGVAIFWPKTPERIDVPGVVEVQAAENTNFVASMIGPRSMNLAQLKFVGLPEGVTMSPRTLDDNFEIGVAADLNAAAGTYPVTVVAELGEKRWEQPFELRLSAATVVLPRDFQRASVTMADGTTRLARLVAAEGKNYFERIERVTSGRLHVTFVLVPRSEQRRKDKDPDTHYMMVDKVSNELFAEFAAARPADLHADTQWTRGGEGRAGDLPAADHPKLPVMRVGYSEAEKFAAWIGGKLPKAEQWDKAAGRFDQSASQPGPFRGVWKPGDARAIAVLQNDGPLPVGAAALDVSRFGCRDMAGNGREWTSSVKAIFEDTSGAPPIRGMELRGRAYNADQPLLFRDLEENEDQGIETEVDNRVDPTIGFRVVVEP